MRKHLIAPDPVAEVTASAGCAILPRPFPSQPMRPSPLLWRCPMSLPLMADHERERVEIAARMAALAARVAILEAAEAHEDHEVQVNPGLPVNAPRPDHPTGTSDPR